MTEPHKIKKRKIFYLGGFDPRGPAVYHRLYKEESHKMCQLTGYHIQVSERTNVDKNVSNWQIQFEDKAGNTVHTDYDFLRWDDVVRSYWPKGFFKLLFGAFEGYSHIFYRGALKKYFTLSRNVGVTTIYPIIITLLVLLLSALISWGITSTLGLALTFRPIDFTKVFAVIFIVMAFLGMRVAKKLSLFWLLRIYLFLSKFTKSKTPLVQTRVQNLAGYIINHINNNEYDEYIIIAHSVGTVVLVPLMAELLERKPDFDTKRIKLLTLGHCIPSVSAGPEAKFYHDALKQISQKDIFWLDASSPSDGVCFALVPPFTGICNHNKVKLKLITPRFHKMFSSKTYRKIRRNKFRMHFQYFMASEHIVEYDYFAMTAGPKPLEEWFESTAFIS